MTQWKFQLCTGGSAYTNKSIRTRTETRCHLGNSKKSHRHYLGIMLSCSMHFHRHFPSRLDIGFSVARYERRMWFSHSNNILPFSKTGDHLSYSIQKMCLSHISPIAICFINVTQFDAAESIIASRSTTEATIWHLSMVGFGSVCISRGIGIGNFIYMHKRIVGIYFSLEINFEFCAVSCLRWINAEKKQFASTWTEAT